MSPEELCLERDSSEPLYLQIANYFRRRIADATYPPAAALPSETDLATLLDVSRPTVRHALHLLLNEGLIDRVPGRGTFVSSRSPVIERPRTGTLALVVLEMRDTFLMRIFTGVEKVASRNDYHVIVSNTGNDLSAEQMQLRDLWEGGKVDGFVIMPADSPEPHETLRQMAHDGAPIVLVDRYFEGHDIPFVASDNLRGGYIETQHLLSLGHRRIAFVTRPNLYTTSVAQRVRGYRQALHDAGIEYDPSLVFQGLLPYLSEIKVMGNSSPQLGEYDRRAIREFLSRQQRPTAVIACNEIIAMQVMDACRDLGLRIPKDIALVGYDDDAVAPILVPPLTTVRQDPRQMGEMAAQQLLNLINGKECQRQVFLPVELIVRQSCGAPI